MLTRCLFLFILSAILHAGIVSADAGAEETSSDRKDMALSTSLVTPFFGSYVLEGTVRVSESFGVLMNASYLSMENPEDGRWTTRTGTVGFGLDYYFPHEALRRVYLEAIGEVLFSSWRYRSSDDVAPIVRGYSGIALAGYRFICKRGAMLDLGAGVVALHFPSAQLQLDGGDSLSSAAFTNVYPAVKLHVGWAF